MCLWWCGCVCVFVQGGGAREIVCLWWCVCAGSCKQRSLTAKGIVEVWVGVGASIEDASETYRVLVVVCVFCLLYTCDAAAALAATAYRRLSLFHHILFRRPHTCLTLLTTHP